MPEKREEETPKTGVQRIDMRALERGVRKALEIEPRDRRGREKQEGRSRTDPARHDKKE
ncbi:MAG: hypothetical protein OXO50_16845 [Caldilineaceae bacterium]|nr:hypothetical protein [Caldilineaceae bacterium]